MTPTERAVIRAARALRESDPYNLFASEADTSAVALAEALSALDQEQAGEPLPWADVVEGDEVFSPKTGKWYRVRSNNPRGAKRAVQAENVGKPWVVTASDLTQVRRGPTGAAVDTIVEVFRSR